LPRVAVDHERVLQLASNLLSNAAKFTPARGRVTLAARHTGREIVVSVRDNWPRDCTMISRAIRRRLP